MLRNCKEAKRKTRARQLATSFLMGREGCTILSSREPLKAKCARFKASLVYTVNARPVVCLQTNKNPLCSEWYISLIPTPRAGTATQRNPIKYL